MIFDHTLDLVNADNWTGLDVRMALLRSTGTAPVGTETTMTQVFSGGCVELTDTNYARVTLSGLTVLEDGADRGLDANSPTIDDLGGAQSVRGALVFIHDTDDDGSQPIAYFQKSPVLATTGGDFTVAWATAGLITYTAT